MTDELPAMSGDAYLGPMLHPENFKHSHHKTPALSMPPSRRAFETIMFGIVGGGMGGFALSRMSPVTSHALGGAVMFAGDVIPTMLGFNMPPAMPADCYLFEKGHDYRSAFVVGTALAGGGLGYWLSYKAAQHEKPATDLAQVETITLSQDASLHR